MKFRWEKKYLYWGITAFLVIVCSILFYMTLNHLDSVVAGVKNVTAILMPFILGFGFAYIINPIVKFTETKWFTPIFTRWKVKRVKIIARVLGIAAAILFAIIIVSGILVMVVPQLAKSIIGVINSLPEYLLNLEKWVSQLLADNSEIQKVIEQQMPNLNNDILDWAKNIILPQVNTLVSGITTGIMGAFNVIKNIFIAIIVSIYVLYSKEHFAAQAKKIIYTVFSVRAGNRILKTSRKANSVFGGFIIGKIIDSAIIGVLCFVGMSLFNWISPRDFPYVLLISVIIGVTNIIPFFGPFIGAIPCGLLVLMIDPVAAFYFVVFILLLQQLDGNVIGPKILGDSTGLTAFWVIFAILLGGGLFGFTGMLLGVPAFAVIYTIVAEIIDTKLKRNEMPNDINFYYDVEKIDVLTQQKITMDDIQDDDVKKYTPASKAEDAKPKEE